MVLSEVAKIVGLHQDTLRYAILDGRLPAEKMGPVWTVSLADVQQAIADGRLNPGKPGRPRRSTDPTS